MRIATHTTETVESGGLATINEACRFLRIGRSLLYQLLAEKRLPRCRIGGARRVPWSELHRFVAENTEK